MAINLRAEIRPDLWGAIAKRYESQVYSAAILEAVHLLSTTLRERANVDGDGISLVSQALGGDSPRLRINKFQTETEKNEQKGLEQILRGLYQGIRNPRSHEQFEDTKEAADAIILFINHIIGVISEAKEPFTIDEWSKRVFDADFVASSRYAKLLAAEVPSKKYNEVLIAIFRNKASGDGDKLSYILAALIELAGDDKIDDFLAVVSDELRTENGESEVRLTLQVLPERLWPRISEVARLRIENKLIQSIESGRYDETRERCLSGSLGTWARDYIKYFSLKAELIEVLAKKFTGDPDEQNYVAKYLFWSLPDSIKNQNDNTTLIEHKTKRFVRLIVKAVANPNGPRILREVFLHTWSFSEDWKKLIRDEIELVKQSDPVYFEQYLDDDIPF